MNEVIEWMAKRGSRKCIGRGMKWLCKQQRSAHPSNAIARQPAESVDQGLAILAFRLVHPTANALPTSYSRIGRAVDFEAHQSAPCSSNTSDWTAVAGCPGRSKK
jgi:hypothetical protein